MTSTRERVAIGLGTATLIWGLTSQLGPQREDDRHRPPPALSQQMEDLADADDLRKDRHRDAGNDGIDAEIQRERTPSERRPAPRPPRLRFP